MRNAIIPILALFLLASAFPVSAQGGPVELAVEAHDGEGAYWFQLAGDGARNPNLGLLSNTEYVITVSNVGSAPHNFHVGGSIDAKTAMLGPGESAELRFTTPSNLDGVEYWCDPHQSLGMKGMGAAIPESKDTPLLGIGVAGIALLGVAVVRRH